MRDIDVRRAMRARLEAEHANDTANTLFVEELDLMNQVRVDLAVVNGSLSGYELKSTRDDLHRLPNQVHVYSQVLDFAWLVVAERHARAAMEIIRPWWGVIVARGDVDGVDLHLAREAQMNPDIAPRSLVELLWKEEAVSALRARGASHGIVSKPRAAAWSRLVETCESDEIRDVVRSALKQRQDWRAKSIPVPRRTRANPFLARRLTRR